MNVPGAVAKHAIIEPACRQGRGDAGAFEAAADRLRDEYWALLKAWGRTGARFHLVLTVEKPDTTGPNVR